MHPNFILQYFFYVFTINLKKSSRFQIWNGQLFQIRSFKYLNFIIFENSTNFLQFRNLYRFRIESAPKLYFSIFSYIFSIFEKAKQLLNRKWPNFPNSPLKYPNLSFLSFQPTFYNSKICTDFEYKVHPNIILQSL